MNRADPSRTIQTSGVGTSVPLTIDGVPVTAAPGQTVLAAAHSLGIDIPTLCYLEKCGPLNSCSVCLVKINGKLVPSCGTKVQAGMVVESETEDVHEARRTAMELLFSDHVGDCLSPCHRLCPLGLNIPVMLRQLQADQPEQAALTLRDAMPLAGVLGRLCHHPCEQGCRRGNWDEPAGIRNMEKFVADWEQNLETDTTAGGAAAPRTLTACKPATHQSVVIIGSGPAGLAAAFYLIREGHAVTVVDRHSQAGGALRGVAEELLPKAVLDFELMRLARLGIQFKLGVELGDHVSIDGLSRGFDAILLTVGELAGNDGEKLTVPFAGKFIKADPNTCLTPVARVFAAGAAVKSVTQVVRAMAEGKAVAECIHRFLRGQPPRRPEKPISSVMGRLEPGELRQFLATASGRAAVSPCDRCAGLNRAEASAEAARCLHCDCRSSGQCLLQHYAQAYSVEPNRFRSSRRKFEQVRQAGGVIFEPGKCILCGICVKLTELAREPLGLTFIGRGFEVRVAAPLDHGIGEGLQKVAQECVEHCPTGALAFAEGPT